MALTYGGRVVATYTPSGAIGWPIMETLDGWDTITANMVGPLMSAFGDVHGLGIGPNVSFYYDVVLDGSTGAETPFIRIGIADVFIDNDVYGGVTLNSISALLATAFNDAALRTAIGVAFTTTVTFTSLQFEVWGNGLVPGP